MARMVNVRIENLDGTTETVQYVEYTQVHDGVLRLRRYRSYSGESEDLGNYPLASIRKWTTTDA